MRRRLWRIWCILARPWVIALCCVLAVADVAYLAWANYAGNTHSKAIDFLMYEVLGVPPNLNWTNPHHTNTNTQLEGFIVKAAAADSGQDQYEWWLVMPASLRGPNSPPINSPRRFHYDQPRGMTYGSITAIFIASYCRSGWWAPVQREGPFLYVDGGGDHIPPDTERQLKQEFWQFVSEYAPVAITDTLHERLRTTNEQIPRVPRIVELPTRTLWGGYLHNALAAVIALAIPLGVSWWLTPMPRRAHRRQNGLCIRCRYDLAGTSPEAPCPECGHTDPKRTHHPLPSPA